MPKWEKGQSGNPGGRPKMLAEVRDLARQHAPAVIEGLARLALKAESAAVRVSASRELLDRAYGRAGPLVPGYDDVLADDHGGTITIEFVGPTDQTKVIDGKPSDGVNGSRH
jgi:hypothetical protein